MTSLTMTPIQRMKLLFEKHFDEYTKFEREQSPRHPCPDICAFILLHELAPLEPGRYMVRAARHDELWLGADVDVVAAAACEAQILTLVRCGVSYDEGCRAFHLFT